MAVMDERQKSIGVRRREMVLSLSLWSSSLWLDLSRVEGMQQPRRQEGVDVGMSNQDSSRSITRPINHCTVRRVKEERDNFPPFRRQIVSIARWKEKGRAPDRNRTSSTRDKGKPLPLRRSIFVGVGQSTPFPDGIVVTGRRSTGSSCLVCQFVEQ